LLVKTVLHNRWTTITTTVCCVHWWISTEGGVQWFWLLAPWFVCRLRFVRWRYYPVSADSILLCRKWL